MVFRRLALAALAVFGLSVGAQAGTVTFNLGGATSTGSNPGGWSDSLSYSQGGIDLTVTGGPTANNRPAWVKTWASHGLGVCNADEQPTCATGDHQLDSFGLDEFVTLAFSQSVTLTKIVFNYVDASDTFDLFPDGIVQIDNGPLPDTKLATVTFNPGFTADDFRIGAGTSSVTECAQWGWKNGVKVCTKQRVVWKDSAFKIMSVTVDVPPPPPPVPLPASALLLAGGLGLLGAMRRRRG